MRKRYFVRDEDEGYSVEEVTEDELEEEIINDEDVDEVKDDVTLKEDEILALKRLASVADKIIDLLHTEEKEHAEDEDEEIIEDEDEEIIEDEDEEIIEDEDEDEEVVDTDERKTCDSKRSFGSIQKKSRRTDDSLKEDAVCTAWAKRYGGIK